MFPKHPLSPGHLLLVACLLQVTAVVQSKVSSGKACLEQVEVSGTTSTSANLTWVYSCDRNELGKVKIYFEHLKYLQCDEVQNEGKVHKKGTVKNFDLEHSSLMIGGLQPDSQYRFSVKTVTKGSRPSVEEKFQDGQTSEAVPQVQVTHLTQVDREEEGELEFSWTPPSPDDCHQFNSGLGHLTYTLTGLEDWNKGETKQANLTIDTDQLVISSLPSYSRYLLTLVVTDKAGQYSSDAGSSVTGQTPATSPLPPTALSLLDPSRLRWSPAIQPTGVPGRHQVRWRQDGGNWTLLPVPEAQDLTCSQEYAQCCCFTLPPNSGGTYQVQAFNMGVDQGSGWSNPLVVELENEPGLLLAFLLGVIFLVIIVVIVIVVVIKCNIRSRWEGFKPTPSDDYSLRPIMRDSTRSTTKSNTMSTITTPTTPPGPVLATQRSFVSLSLPSNRRSTMDPLPPVPGKVEPIYQEIARPEEPNPAQLTHLDASKAPLAVAEDGYLDPVILRPVASLESLDEEGYLRPNCLLRQTPESDPQYDAGYMKPTFNRFSHLDTRSPSRELAPPPAIPAVSYSSQEQLDRGQVRV